MRCKTAASEQAEVDRFNRAHMVGVRVRYWTGSRGGLGKVSVTRTPAQLLSGHTAVVWVDGEPSCISLTHIQVLAKDQTVYVCKQGGRRVNIVEEFNGIGYAMYVIESVSTGKRTKVRKDQFNKRYRMELGPATEVAMSNRPVGGP